MIFSVGTIIAAIGFFIIWSTNASFLKKLAMFVPVAVLAAFFQASSEFNKRSEYQKSFEYFQRQQITPELTFRSDDFILFDDNVVANEAVEDLVGNAIARGGERVVLSSADVEADFRTSDCINNINVGGLSMRAVPLEMWLFCAGQWNMDEIRNFMRAAENADVSLFDFFDFENRSGFPAQMQSLSADEFRTILLQIDELAKSQFPDLIDVVHFIRLNSLLWLLDKDETIFTDAGKIRKLNSLKPYFKPTEVVLEREGMVVDVLLNLNPEVHLISNSMSDLKLEQIIVAYGVLSSRTKSATFQFLFGEQHNFANIFAPNEFLSSYLVAASSIMLSVRAQILNENGYETHIPTSELVKRPLFIFVGRELFEKSSCLRQKDDQTEEAFVTHYCAPQNAVHTMSIFDENSDDPVYKNVSAEMIHEIYHHFLNPKHSEVSPFAAEIMATGAGEAEARTYQAAITFSNSGQNTELSKELVEKILAAASQPSMSVSAEIARDQEKIRKAIASEALTNLDRKMLCKLGNYSEDEEWFSGKYLKALLELSSTSWHQLNAETRDRAYVAAWVLGRFSKFGDETTLWDAVDITPIFEMVKTLANSGSLNDQDVLVLSEIARNSKQHVLNNFSSVSCVN